MRWRSPKTTKLAKDAKQVRDMLIAACGECMICGRSPKSPHRGKPPELSQLCCHEIANGPHRLKALDKPYAILVLCWWCNGNEVEDKAKWPQARQLALLQRRSPHNYDLAAFNSLVNPRAPQRITQDEVDEYGGSL